MGHPGNNFDCCWKSMKRRKHEPFAATTFLSIYFEIYTRDLKLAGSVALSTLQNTLLSRVHGQAFFSINHRGSQLYFHIIRYVLKISSHRESPFTNTNSSMLLVFVRIY
jgi:hypothetical protein